MDSTVNTSAQDSPHPVSEWLTASLDRLLASTTNGIAVPNVSVRQCNPCVTPFIYPSVRLCIRVRPSSICPCMYVCMHACMVCMRACMRACVCLSVRPSVRPCMYPCVHLSVRPSVYVSVCPCEHPFVRAPRRYVHVSMRASVCECAL